MGTKTISIKEDVYRRLKELKKEGMSFSDVIQKLTEREKNDFSNIVGTSNEASWEELEDERERKKEDDRREKILS